jgi:hypothetical protein
VTFSIAPCSVSGDPDACAAKPGCLQAAMTLDPKAPDTI